MCQGRPRRQAVTRYRGVGKNRTPHVFCHGYGEAAPDKNPIRLQQPFIPSWLVATWTYPNPFAKICEWCVWYASRVAVGIFFYQHDGGVGRHG
jgi:hypothetical protein